MDSRRSKKTRSYVEPSKASRASHASRSSASSSTSAARPGLGDRTHSAPSVDTPRERQERRQTRTSSLAQQGSGAGDESRDGNEPILSPGPADEDETAQASNGCRPVEDVGEMLEVNIAVLGAVGVGKSTFVRCALDLKQPARSPISSKRVSLEGVLIRVILLEVQLGGVKISDNQRIEWPQRLGEQNTPRIDGALVLYDVMEQGSIARIPEVLNAFSRCAMPWVLVSNKCDNPPHVRHINPHVFEQHCNALGDTESFHASVNTPETHKRCISAVLRNFVPNPSGNNEKLLNIASPQALTLTQSTTAVSSTQSSNTSKNHIRANSEMTAYYTGKGALSSQNPSPIGGAMKSPTDERSHGSRYNHISSKSSNTIPTRPIFSTGTQSAVAADTGTERTRAGPRGQNLAGDLTTAPRTSSSSHPTEKPSSSTAVDDSLLEVEEELGEEVQSTKAGSDLRTENSVLAERTINTSGVSFDDLIDRLLSQPMSKSDAKFASIFLCLYRKFAAPAELLSAIVSRFERLESDDGAQILRISSQLRYLSIMAQWIADYSGDLAHPLTRRRIAAFTARLAGNRVYATAAKQMNAQLEVVSEDDDTEWACSDISRERATTIDSFVSFSSVRSTSSTLEANDCPDENPKVFSGSSSEEGAKSRSTRTSTTPSTSSSTGRSGSQSTSSPQRVLSPLESAQRQAQLLIPIPRTALTKIQWHQVMDYPDDEIARELTRIDWIMFSSIRPRDLVRHVSLSSDQKEKCRSLENVNRMIHQFNHVAFWVANMILLRDKPKHRAKALEKFMGLAWKLRQLNNYNSLGAIIAGINGTAVHRLTQTRELITQQAQKDFMRLEILMGTQKSHFAYRLAWENTSSERIPFLPLHRRDLVSAEEGNKTFVGGAGRLINWKKFEVMGEVIVGIQRSQGTPYPNVARNEEIQRLILEGRFCKDDDELYDRSTQLEPPAIGENARKRFNWFQR